jgi:hypothetical protein
MSVYQKDSVTLPRKNHLQNLPLIVVVFHYPSSFTDAIVNPPYVNNAFPLSLQWIQSTLHPPAKVGAYRVELPPASVSELLTVDVIRRRQCAIRMSLWIRGSLDKDNITVRGAWVAITSCAPVLGHERLVVRLSNEVWSGGRTSSLARSSRYKLSSIPEYWRWYRNP